MTKCMFCDAEIPENISHCPYCDAALPVEAAAVRTTSTPEPALQASYPQPAQQTAQQPFQPGQQAQQQPGYQQPGFQQPGHQQPGYQQPGYQQPQPPNAVGTIPASYDSGSIGWGVLGFFFPIVGLVLFLVWKNTKPKSAKVAGMGAIIGFVLSLASQILLVLAD